MTWWEVMLGIAGLVLLIFSVIRSTLAGWERAQILRKLDRTINNH